MIRITITPAAFAAIAATLALGTVAVEPERDEDGSVHIWLDPGVLAKLKAMRWLGRELQRHDHLRALKGDRAPVFASKRPALIEPALT